MTLTILSSTMALVPLFNMLSKAVSQENRCVDQILPYYLYLKWLVRLCCFLGQALILVTIT